MLSTIKSKAAEWFVVVLLFGGVFYAATTAWRNEEKLTVVGDDVKSIKTSMISLLLDEKPDKSSIAKDLVSDTRFLKGIENFKSGDIKNAYAVWKASALDGNRDSVYAIAVANDALRIKLHKAGVSEAEKGRLSNILKSAPRIEEKNGMYILPPKN
jgi:hypothetical protein